MRGGEDGIRETGDDGGGEDASDSVGGGVDDLDAADANMDFKVCCLIVVQEQEY